MENRVIRGKGEKKRRGEEEIELEEIRNVIRKLKTGKAIGRDGIPNEAWKFGGEEIEKWIWKICNRVWKGKNWPEQ